MTRSDDALSWQVQQKKLSEAAEGAYHIARGLRRTVTETSAGCLAVTSAHQGFSCLETLARLHAAHSAHFEGHAAEAEELTHRFLNTGTSYAGAEHAAGSAAGRVRRMAESERQV